MQNRHFWWAQLPIRNMQHCWPGRICNGGKSLIIVLLNYSSMAMYKIGKDLWGSSDTIGDHEALNSDDYHSNQSRWFDYKQFVSHPISYLLYNIFNMNRSLAFLCFLIYAVCNPNITIHICVILLEGPTYPDSTLPNSDWINDPLGPTLSNIRMLYLAGLSLKK